MKCTISLTQDCNLSCSYCYSHRNNTSMTTHILEQSIAFIFQHASPTEKINIGLFGGEPLLEFYLVKQAIDLIEQHPQYAPDRVELSLVSNGTIYSPTIAEFLKRHDVGLGISCDGAPETQDHSRKFTSGKGSSAIVEKNIRNYLQFFPELMVNAVYTPETVASLPDTVRYFSALGVRQIYLTPDYSSDWTPEIAQQLEAIYRQIGDLFIAYQNSRDPHYISLIDSKITVILGDGYQAGETCQMGKKEWAFSPSGKIYPCERLIGKDDGAHAIGDLSHGLALDRMQCREREEGNPQCKSCSLNKYCMNWCGCSNFMASGYYNQSSAFLCASEQAAIREAFRVFQNLKEINAPALQEYLFGQSSQTCAQL